MRVSSPWTWSRRGWIRLGSGAIVVGMGALLAGLMLVLLGESSFGPGAIVVGGVISAYGALVAWIPWDEALPSIRGFWAELYRRWPLRRATWWSRRTDGPGRGVVAAYVEAWFTIGFAPIWLIPYWRNRRRTDPPQ